MTSVGCPASEWGYEGATRRRRWLRARGPKWVCARAMIAKETLKPASSARASSAAAACPVCVLQLSGGALCPSAAAASLCEPPPPSRPHVPDNGNNNIISAAWFTAVYFSPHAAQLFPRKLCASVFVSSSCMHPLPKGWIFNPHAPLFQPALRL